MNKKILFLILLGFLVLPTITFGAWTAPAEPSGALTDIASLVSEIVYYVWVIFAGMGVIMIMVAGILFLTANGDPGKLTTARNAFFWGAVGIGVGILAYSVTYIMGGILGETLTGGTPTP